MAKKEAIRLRAPRPKDKFGDPTGPVPDWRDETALAVVPRSSEDYEQRGPIIISGYMVAISSIVPVSDRDEVEIRGEVFQIEGAVGDYGRKKIFYTERAN